MRCAVSIGILPPRFCEEAPAWCEFQSHGGPCGKVGSRRFACGKPAILCGELGTFFSGCVVILLVGFCSFCVVIWRCLCGNDWGNMVVVGEFCGDLGPLLGNVWKRDFGGAENS